MTSINSKVLVVLLIIGMAAIPALGNSGGPPYLNQDGDQRSNMVVHAIIMEQFLRAVVMITSVPICMNWAKVTNLQLRLRIH